MEAIPNEKTDPDHFSLNDLLNRLFNERCKEREESEAEYIKRVSDACRDENSVTIRMTDGTLYQGRKLSISGEAVSFIEFNEEFPRPVLTDKISQISFMRNGLGEDEFIINVIDGNKYHGKKLETSQDTTRFNEIESENTIMKQVAKKDISQISFKRKGTGVINGLFGGIALGAFSGAMAVNLTTGKVMIRGDDMKGFLVFAGGVLGAVAGAIIGIMSGRAHPPVTTFNMN